MRRSAQLAGRVVLVTGASSGIGEATALLCAQHGAALALGARRGDRLDAVAQRCRAAGAVDVHRGVVDLSVTGAAQAFTATAEAALGPVDVLVNNAGSGWTGRFVEMDEADMERIVETNLVGTMRMTRAVLPGMLARESGTIVMVASVVAITPLPYSSVYCASKQAMVGFAQALRAELAGTLVKIGLVYPAATETEFHLNAPLTTGSPMVPATAVAADVLAAIEQPERNPLPASWRWRQLTDPLVGGRRRARIAKAFRAVDPTLAARR
jgi:short-subunit dehydrogenase